MSGAVFKAESECLGECGRGKSGFPLLVGNIALTVRSEHFSVQLRTELMCRELRVSWCVRRSCSEGECPVPPAVTPWHSSKPGSSGGKGHLGWEHFAFSQTFSL